MMRVALRLFSAPPEGVWEELQGRLRSHHSIRYAKDAQQRGYWYVLLQGEPAEVEADVAALGELGRADRFDQRPFEQCPEAKLKPLVYTNESVAAYCRVRSWQTCLSEVAEFCPLFPQFYDPQTVIEPQYEGYMIVEAPQSAAGGSR